MKEHYVSVVPRNKDINFVYDTELVILQQDQLGGYEIKECKFSCYADYYSK
jgi:hypothetical protein